MTNSAIISSWVPWLGESALNPLANGLRLDPLTEHPHEVRLAKNECEPGEQFEVLLRREAQEHEQRVHRFAIERTHVDRLSGEEDAERRPRNIGDQRHRKCGIARPSPMAVVMSFSRLTSRS